MKYIVFKSCKALENRIFNQEMLKKIIVTSGNELHHKIEQNPESLRSETLPSSQQQSE